MGRCLKILAVWGCVVAIGCQPFQGPSLTAPGLLFEPPPGLAGGPATGTVAAIGGVDCANPLFVPVTNQEWAWEQIVDVVDDYFRVERETPVRLVGSVVTEGRIDTFPQVGATWMEPHRPDSVGWDNRWESTFQTIRRRAVLRVIPEQGGYLVRVDVFKELEDLPRPESSTVGAATFRNDSSLVSQISEPVSRTRLSKEWISLGQDCIVEQQILTEIRDRLAAGF